MDIHVDDAKIREAARALHDADTSYGEGDEQPSLAVYEAAIATWLENAAEGLLQEPEYYAYGPNRIISYTFWEAAFSHAQHWHNHPLTQTILRAQPGGAL